jgi:hypothetical protein
MEFPLPGHKAFMGMFPHFKELALMPHQEPEWLKCVLLLQPSPMYNKTLDTHWFSHLGFTKFLSM